MDSETLLPRFQAVIYHLLRNIAEIEQHNTADHSITVAQSYSLLAFPPQGSIGMSDLADSLGLAKSTLTRMADQLVKRGLVERLDSPQDRRAVHVRLTEQGRTLRTQIEADYRTFFANVLAHLPDPEQARVVHSLELLVEAVMVVMQEKYPDPS
jgi:DNA-binding MarR family transcriptional regulator